MKKIGLLINPIAGMGGSVGLKGTDGEAYVKALRLGAQPISPARLTKVLSNIENKDKLFILVAPGKMGADILQGKGYKFKIIGHIGDRTSAQDTKRIAKKMLDNNIELLVFCGGDGTARDIYTAIGLKIPVVAVPSGVKMFSSVFSLNPRAAAKMIDAYVKGTDTQEKEILDINEVSFRKGILDSRLYGYLKVPNIERLLQSSKSDSKINKTALENKAEIAENIIENMKTDILYLLGPGTTVKAITDELNLPKTLLGIDAIFNKKRIGKDLNEEGILKLLNQYNNAEIIVSPIGGQGFIFGRGNKQFTPKVILKVGKEKITIIATAEKMSGLTCLRVDTDDIETDKLLSGYIKVIIGYKEELISKIEI